MIPASTSRRIAEITGSVVTQSSALSGGCVGDVFQVSLKDGRSLVAKLGSTGSGLDLEGLMLNALKPHLPVPNVYAADDTLLVMACVDSAGGLDKAAQEHAADLVAHLHSVSTNKGFGYDVDTVIGGLHQPNPWTPSWRDFFRDQRLLYMGGEALRAGRLPGRVYDRLETFCGRLDTWIDEPAQPSLIHGDMWSGNVLAAPGRITGFIDPAIYFADPEIELAFTTLFGTFGDAFFSRYQEHRPIRPGFFEERCALYNLYPLLVHVRLFGGSYVNQVSNTLEKFGA